MVGIADVASVATAVGAGIYQLRLSWKQGRASFEQSFVDRYWSIEDDGLRGTDAPQVNRQRYLRLCEDQFEHARLGQISRRTWVIWHDGIRLGLVGHVEGDYAWSTACSPTCRTKPIAAQRSGAADVSDLLPPTVPLEPDLKVNRSTP